MKMKTYMRTYLRKTSSNWMNLRCHHPQMSWWWRRAGLRPKGSLSSPWRHSWPQFQSRAWQTEGSNSASGTWKNNCLEAPARPQQWGHWGSTVIERSTMWKRTRAQNCCQCGSLHVWLLWAFQGRCLGGTLQQLWWFWFWWWWLCYWWEAQDNRDPGEVFG